MLRLLSSLLALGLAVTSPVTAAAEERPLRLVTFNLLHGGPWSGLTGRDDQLEARLALMIEQLRALDPDVIALQESPVTRWRGDVAARLASALGLQQVHARATEHVFPWRWLSRTILGVLGFVEGPAVLSRFPIVASQIYQLPQCVKRIDPRVAVRADLATPAGILRIVCTHTSRDDCQTRRVADLARDNPGALPVVLMGDLNTGETAPALHELLDAGFVDVFRAANADAPGATVWQDVNAPVATVRRRVDYVLLWPGRAVSADIRSSRIVLNRPRRDGDGTTLWPSDHYGIFAEIALVPRSPQ